jgi:dihydrofolate reductase
MGHVFADMTMSLDGFVAAPGIDVERPFGDGGERLHRWLFAESSDPADRQAGEDMFTSTGAFLIGRRTFDVGIGTWGNDGAFGKPCFVVTTRPREKLVKGPTTFTFVADGIAGALEQAKAAAGEENVCVMGGASLARQYLTAGLIDEINIHLMPVIFGAGTRLFDDIGAAKIELDRTSVTESPHATHLRFRVCR